MLQSMKKIWLYHIYPLIKKNRIDDFKHWPASIKSTVQWFHFHAVMEYTGNIMQYYTHLTSSLLKMFSMFEIRLSCGDDDFGQSGFKVY